MSQAMQHIRFANGTTALWAALKALGCENGDIAVPSTICPSVICAIFASGNRPYFVDIERRRLGLDPKQLAIVLPQVKAVIAVHAYGIPCDIAAIANLCKASDVPLIEDCCQSQGAEFDGEATGRFGNVAIYSYGAGKIIEAGGGGALETSDTTLAEKVRLLADALPEADEGTVRDLGLFYKFFYNQFYPDRLQHYQAIFTRMLKEIGPRLLGRYSSSLDSAIDQGLRGLDHNIRLRKQKAALYSVLLADVEGLEELAFPDDASPWRFNILLDFPARQFVLKRMLQESWAVSSWSPSISQFMEPGSYAATALSNSTWLSEGILNFWVNEDTDEQQVTETCDFLKRLLEEHRTNCEQRNLARQA